MRFWLGLILSLFGGLVGIGLFREWTISKFAALDNTILDIVSLIILLLGLIISAFDHFKQSRDFEKLQNEQKGRVLEPIQRKNLLKSLKNTSKIRIELMSIQGDRESFRFANTIKDVLTELNWEVDGVWEEIIIGGVGPGIAVRESSMESNSIGKTITQIFKDNNIDTRIITKSDLKPNLIQVIVGSRP
ncbi:hypothetical protein [uncultured Lacinutrix sp.]|uniref:hypothetical protein n=1 Tax=uncultured Lacinutrix sp. TaxID=574032 RepID=UPI002626BD0E|nr:hypothetical protein [uncultured Lacinutrix sp.]